MDCRQIRGRLVGLLDGDLAPQEAVQVRRHLEGCGECLGSLEELSGFDALWQEHLPAPRATYSTQDLLSRLEQVESLEVARHFLPALPVHLGGPHLATAALLVVMTGNLQQSLVCYTQAAEGQQRIIQARMNELEKELVEANLVDPAVEPQRAEDPDKGRQV